MGVRIVRCRKPVKPHINYIRLYPWKECMDVSEALRAARAFIIFKPFIIIIYVQCTSTM